MSSESSDDSSPSKSGRETLIDAKALGKKLIMPFSELKSKDSKQSEKSKGDNKNSSADSNDNSESQTYCSVDIHQNTTIEQIKWEVNNIAEDMIYDIPNKIQLYLKYIWETKPIFFDKSSSIICGTNNGNFIAVMSKPSLTQRWHTISIYNYKIELINEIRFEGYFTNAFMHFTTNGHLFVVASSNDEVKNLTIFEFFSFNEISEVSYEIDSEVNFCQMWDAGFCIVTSKNFVWYFPQYSDPEVFHIDCEETLICCTIMHPKAAKSRCPIVYAAGEDNKLYIAGLSINTSLEFPSKILYISLNPLNDFILFGMEDGSVAAMTSDLTINVYNIFLTMENKFVYFGWLGDYIPLVASDESIYTIDNEGMVSYINVNSSPLIFNLSPSGVLIFANYRMYVMGEISDGMATCFNKDSNANTLCQSYEEKSFTKAINLGQNNLIDAVGYCIMAAKEAFFNTDMQKYFISAATYGLSLIPGGMNSEFVKSMKPDKSATSEDNITFTDKDFDIPSITKVMRLLNNMRDDLNVIVNYNGAFNCLKSGAAILRYCDLNKFAKAIEIAKLSGHKKSIAVTEWCRSVINRVEDPEDIMKILTTKRDKGLNPSDVAVIAKQIKGMDLAIEISHLERYPQRLIPFFVNEKMWESALDAAVDSLDSSELEMVLSQSLEELDQEKLREIISKNKDLYYIISAMIDTLKVNSSGETVNDTTWSKLPSILLSADATSDTCEGIVKRTLRRVTLPVKEGDQHTISDFNEQFPSPKMKHQIKVLEDLKTIDSATPGSSKPLNRVLVEKALKDGIKDAVRLGKDAGFSKQRCIEIIARGFIRAKKFEELNEFSSKSYKKHYDFMVSLIYTRLGYDKAIEFVELIPDKNASKKLIANLTKWNEDTTGEMHPKWGESALSSHVLFN